MPSIVIEGLSCLLRKRRRSTTIQPMRLGVELAQRLATSTFTVHQLSESFLMGSTAKTSTPFRNPSRRFIERDLEYSQTQFGGNRNLRQFYLRLHQGRLPDGSDGRWKSSDGYHTLNKPSFLVRAYPCQSPLLRCKAGGPGSRGSSRMTYEGCPPTKSIITELWEHSLVSVDEMER